MTSWKSGAAALLDATDRLAGRVKNGLARARGTATPVILEPYLGYGTRNRVRIAGRVLEHAVLNPARPEDPRWRNLARFYRALESDEVPGMTVRGTLLGQAVDAISDDEGYVAFDFENIAVLPGLQWHDVRFEVRGPRAGAASTGRVLVPPDSARYGVVSDIDDTVIRTGVHDKLRMLLRLAVTNHHTRLPFPGVAAFYRALHAGIDGNAANPIFYVSSSPWNLYGPLVEFLALHGIPQGPLHLKDYGDHTLFAAGDHATHKLASIERVLSTYPALPFVLIGDSAEQDPEIYREVVRRHPGRIRVIYIRSVVADERRLAAIDGLAAEVRRDSSELVLAPDSEFAAVHAASTGLINPAALPGIRSEKREDRAAP